jgi:hypothetical protein
MEDMAFDQEIRVDTPSVRREGGDKSSKEGTSLPRGAVDGKGRLNVSRMRPSDVLALQRAVGNAGVAEALEEGAGNARAGKRSSVHDVIAGQGQPLDAGLRSRMESALGADFGDVKVHSGPEAAASAAEVGAHAYTTGNNVVLGSGVDASSPTAQRTLAHELTHVVQQRSGPVDGTPAPGGIRLSSPSDRFEQEAERVADAVTSGGGASLQRMEAVPGAGAAIQREAEEEDVQTLAIQREAEEEDVQTLAIQREAEEEASEE